MMYEYYHWDLKEIIKFVWWKKLLNLHLKKVFSFVSKTSNVKLFLLKILGVIQESWRLSENLMNWL